MLPDPIRESWLKFIPLAAAFLLSGCKLLELPGDAVRAITGQEEEVQTDPALLQQDIFRFCDEYSNQLSAEIDRILRAHANMNESALVRVKLSLNYRLMEVAAAPNDYVNLCDLVFLVALSRKALEDHPVVQAAGEDGTELINLIKEYEQQIYDLARKSLGEEARESLEQNVTNYLKNTYMPGNALYTRYTGLSSEVIKDVELVEKGQTNLLGLLMLDPLSGLDPTTREIAKSRLFAERAMYVAQRMPKLIRMEGELVSYRLIETPEVSTLLTNLDSLSASIDRVSLVAEKLPGEIQAEREAVIEAFEGQSPQLEAMMRETHDTVTATNEALATSNELVKSVDSLLDQLGIYRKQALILDAVEETGDTESIAESTTIQDVTTAVQELGQTAEQLTLLISNIDQTLAAATSEEMTAKVDAAVSGSREAVDFLFWRAVLFVAVSCLIVLLTALLFRAITRRRQTS